MDIYNTTEEIELSDEELLYIGTDEPSNYKQAEKSREWKVAMKKKI